MADSEDMPDVPRVWWQPENEQGEACLIIEVNGPKTYLRWWNPGQAIMPQIEWGWTLHESVIELVPKPPETS